MPLTLLRRLAVLIALPAAACADAVAPPLEPWPADWTSLGMVEITLSDVGSPSPRAEARVAPTTPVGGARLSLGKPQGSGVATDGTIHLQALSTGSFTVGTRGAGGVRYVFSTFRVRNATSPTAKVPSQPYPTPRTNLTFVAVATAGTLRGTAVSRLARYDGTAANPAIAVQVMPTGAVTQETRGALRARFPDVLQVFEEAEVAAIPLATGASALPYGFVTRNATDLSRTLPAYPAPATWDGLVTFAFRIPLQATPVEDPFTVSFTFVAVDDGQTRVTQSLEERDPAATAAAEARAVALGGSLTALGLDGSAAAARRVCSVRTAGPAGAPTATLFTPATGGFQALTPSGGRISAAATLSAAFTCPAAAAPTAQTFSVRGAQSGLAFREGGYGGGGTATLVTPAGRFRPGEEVEVTLTGALGAGLPHVARYRVASAFAGLRFTVTGSAALDAAPAALLAADVDGSGTADLVGVGGPWVRALRNDGFGRLTGETAVRLGSADLRAAAAADLNGDGRTDVVVGDAAGRVLHVLLRLESGGFQVGAAIPVEGAPTTLAAGDLNGDGHVDLVSGSVAAGKATILLGDGAGGLAVSGTLATGGRVALGDVDGDGRLDLAAAGTGFFSNLQVDFGDGAGGFTAARRWSASVTATAAAVGLTDLNGDGRPELVLLDAGSSPAAIVLGNQAGALSGFPRSYALGAAPEGLALADLDGDGAVDVVASTAGGLYWVSGAGSGSSSARLLALSTAVSGPVAAADLDGDGRIDLAAQRDNASSVSWAENF